MDPLLKALADMPPQEKKRHMVTIDGQQIEVSLQKKLEIMRSGEYAFIIKNGNIVPKPKKRTKVQCKILVKADVGGHFYESDPYWIESVAEKGYQWQIKSE
jgi:hypothetical protein